MLMLVRVIWHAVNVLRHPPRLQVPAPYPDEPLRPAPRQRPAPVSPGERPARRRPAGDQNLGGSM